MKSFPFGDTATVTNTTNEIKIGMNTLDELEYDCWDLILVYANKFGIEIKADDNIDFYAAKEVQESVLKLFKDAGFIFIHEEE